MDNQRKNLRRQFKDQENFKRLKWALLKNAENLTVDDKKKLACAFLVAPQLKIIYEHKEKFRLIFNQKLTREQGEIALTQWIEEAKKIKNKYLDKFFYMLNDWKAYVLNYRGIPLAPVVTICSILRTCLEKVIHGMIQLRIIILKSKLREVIAKFQKAQDFSAKLRIKRRHYYVRLGKIRISKSLN